VLTSVAIEGRGLLIFAVRLKNFREMGQIWNGPSTERNTPDLVYRSSRLEGGLPGSKVMQGMRA
jgi:hypothetical protein